MGQLCARDHVFVWTNLNVFAFQGFQGCRDSELQCSIHGLKHNSVYTINITVVLDYYNMESKTVSLQGTTNEIGKQEFCEFVFLNE